MYVILTLTIFSIDQDVIQYSATHYIKHLAKELDYKIIKVTTGKHIDASRPHYHIMFMLDTAHRKDISGNPIESKIYKTLNEKIHRIINMEYPSKEIADKFRDTERKISFIYEGQTKKFKKKTIVYNEQSMKYPFKEYDSIDKIEMELQYGYTYEELSQMRNLAHQEWLDVKSKQAKQQAIEINKKDNHIAMKEYLNQYLAPFKNEPVDKLVRKTRCLIWDWKTIQYEKGLITSARSAGIKDEAISFLKFNHYCTSAELIDYQDNKY